MYARARSWVLKHLAKTKPRHLVLYFVAFTLSMIVVTMGLRGNIKFLPLIEWMRLQVDRLVCTPAIHELDELDVDDIDLGPQNCTRIHPRVLVPRIYVADQEMDDALGIRCGDCEEFIVYSQVRNNMTGTLVTDVEQADYILIPFPAECHDECEHNSRADFSRAVRAMKPLQARNPRAKLFTVSRRPFPARTNFRKPMRQLLHDHPDVKFLSPDIKNMQQSELKALKTRLEFQNHIVLPQFPLDFAVFDAPFDRNWKRPFRFCFQGTLLNDERSMVAEALSGRDDSFVLANCRSSRSELTNGHFRSSESAVVYSQCEYCPTPRGDTNCDTRFFDAMRAGCIPIVTNRMRPTPYVRHVEYWNWSETYMRNTKVAGFKRLLRDLAQKTEDELHQQRLRMRDAAIHLTHAKCNGAPGLQYALAALNEDRSGLEDLWGYSRYQP